MLSYYVSPVMKSTFDFLVRFVSKTYDIDLSTYNENEFENVNRGSITRYVTVYTKDQRDLIVVKSVTNDVGVETCNLGFVHMPNMPPKLSIVEEVVDKIVFGR